MRSRDASFCYCLRKILAVGSSTAQSAANFINFRSNRAHHRRHFSCMHYHYNKTFRPTPQSYEVPVSHPYELNYLYGRLVINRHLHGSPNGVPLENLERPTLLNSWGDGPLWLETPFPRIIDDELFLCITHSISGERLHCGMRLMRGGTASACM